MLAGPSASILTMRKALAATVAALGAAAKIDLDRTDEDRAFFAKEKAKLTPFIVELAQADHALEDFDLGQGADHQAAVELGDIVLDRGISKGAARIKLALADGPGLGVEHVFDGRATDLTRAPIAKEPGLVFEAADRMNDLPDFPEKDDVQQDLRQRAKQQQKRLDARASGDKKRNQLESNAARLVTDAAHALAATKAALDGRFTRQRDYVASFFLDVSSPRPVKKADAPAPKATNGEAPGPTPNG